MLLSGCSNGQEIAGTYASADGQYSFVLNADSTFSYRYKSSKATAHSEGRWSRLDKNTLVLNSGLATRSPAMKVDEYVAPNPSAHLANIVQYDVRMNAANRARYYGLLYVDDSLYYKRLCSGLPANIVTASCRKVHFGITPVEEDHQNTGDTLFTKHYELKTPTGNHLTVDIALDESMFHYQVFKNMTVNIKKKGIEFAPAGAGKQLLSRW
jgi:hypothetical protein